jgi:hypothetical protein
MKRNYSGTSLKPQRIDKRYPKRFKTTIQQDLGRKIKVTQMSSPYVETSEQTFDKKSSGKWHTAFDRNGLYIRRSTVTGDVYMWTKQGKVTEYVGKLEQVDLWTLGITCFDLLRAFTEVVDKEVKGHKYMRYVLRLSKKFKEQHSGKIRTEFGPNSGSNR